MKKIMIIFSAVSVLVLFQGCFTGYQRSAIVVYDFDERCWHEGHWVYRFYEGDRFVFRRWRNNKWEEEERREAAYWEKQKWVRKLHNDRDDGRIYENEKKREEKKDNRYNEQHENRR